MNEIIDKRHSGKFAGNRPVVSISSSNRISKKFICGRCAQSPALKYALAAWFPFRGLGKEYRGRKGKFLEKIQADGTMLVLRGMRGSAAMVDAPEVSMQQHRNNRVDGGGGRSNLYKGWVNDGLQN
jgi:hypothetical protein